MSKRENDKKEKARAALKLTSAGLVGQQTIRSGVPRALGVRLESHSTGRKKARNILKNGGMLDPRKGGAGAAKISSDYIDRSKNFVHLTGFHKDGLKEMLGYDVELPKSMRWVSIPSRSLQRKMYRVYGSPGKINPSEFLKGALGIRGRTLYRGGTDKYFNTEFIPDAHDLALKSRKPIKVYGNRMSATVAAVKKEGLKNLVRSNKARVATGGAILTLGGYAAQRLAREGLRNLSDGKVQPHNRRTRSGISRVRSHRREY